MTLYNPEIHDPIVTKYHHQWKLSPHEIAERLEIPFYAIKDQMKRMGMKPYYKQCWTKPGGLDVPPPKSKPNPILVAMSFLSGRLVEKPSGYWLDGRPVNLEKLMRECNKVRVSLGMEQIVYHEGWKV